MKLSEWAKRISYHRAWLMLKDGKIDKIVKQIMEEKDE